MYWSHYRMDDVFLFFFQNYLRFYLPLIGNQVELVFRRAKSFDFHSTFPERKENYPVKCIERNPVKRSDIKRSKSYFVLHDLLSLLLNL